MSKVVVCLCRDVTVEDIDRALALGYDHPETLKRLTGALTGPCQGKACREAIIEAIASRSGVEASSLRRPSSRSPAGPVRLGQLAGGPRVDT